MQPMEQRQPVHSWPIWSCNCRPVSVFALWRPARATSYSGSALIWMFTDLARQAGHFPRCVLIFLPMRFRYSMCCVLAAKRRILQSLPVRLLTSLRFGRFPAGFGREVLPGVSLFHIRCGLWGVIFGHWGEYPWFDRSWPVYCEMRCAAIRMDIYCVTIPSALPGATSTFFQARGLFRLPMKNNYRLLHHIGWSISAGGTTTRVRISWCRLCHFSTMRHGNEYRA